MKCVWLTAVLLLAGCEKEVVQLTIDVDGSRNDARGWRCTEDADPGRYLFQRAAQFGAASVVVDFLRLDGIPGCRLGELYAWCADHPCTPIPETRVCIDIDMSGFTGDVFTDLQDMAAQVSGQVVTEDAPHEPVLVRALAVALPCSQVPTAGAPSLEVDCSRLMGCAYSCPVALGSGSGTVGLDLDVINDSCEGAVKLFSSSSGFSSINVCP